MDHGFVNARSPKLGCSSRGCEPLHDYCNTAVAHRARSNRDMLTVSASTAQLTETCTLQHTHTCIHIHSHATHTHASLLVLTRATQRAIELSTRAIELAPESSHGYIARCISRGRLALLCDNRTKEIQHAHLVPGMLRSCVQILY
eukprot:1158184-Pelagomonas_calceolata.AAC.6